MRTLVFALALLSPLLSTGAAAASTGTEVADPVEPDDPAFQRFAFGLNYYALTYHPNGGGADYPRELDSEAYWVLQIGGEAMADYYLNRWFLLRAAGSLYRDCADVWAGHAHLGFRLDWRIAPRFSARIGIGPTFLWRENWYGVVDRYRSDAFFGRPGKGDRFQNAWIWYGGNIEAEMRLGRGLGLVYSLVPGYPFVMTSSLGLRAGF
jgi:hypothetical protein